MALFVQDLIADRRKNDLPPYFSIAIDINPPSSSNVSGISWSILCREHIKTRKIRIGSWWKKLLKWTMIDILLIGLVIC